MNSVEVWKPVVGFEGRYEVSNMGRVKGLERISAGRWGIVRLSSKILKPRPNKDGYLSVVLYPEKKSCSVHRLVLQAFVGPCPLGYEGCHKNDCQNDNRLENLRWGTPQSNCLEAFSNGVRPRGEQRINAKLRCRDIPKIRKLLNTQTLTEIAKTFLVDPGTILSVKTGRTWSHI